MTKKKEQNITNLEDFAEKAAQKIITDPNKILEGIAEIGKGKLKKQLQFSYKPLTKKIYTNSLEADTQEEAQDYILMNTLWKDSENKYWSLKKINEGIPVVWQSAICGTIIAESGLGVSLEDEDF